MAALLNAILKVKIWKDTRGQEMVEYALLGGFLVTACGAASPVVANNLVTAFSHIVQALDAANNSSGSLPSGRP
jgi:Flp pilus assembly pilin Flp